MSILVTNLLAITGMRDYFPLGTARAESEITYLDIMAAKKTAKKTTAPAPTTPTEAPAPVAKKTAKKAAKKAATKSATPKTESSPAPKADKPATPKAAPKTASRPSADAIARAAYLNYRRRVEQGLPGDSHGDWLEAERQLG